MIVIYVNIIFRSIFCVKMDVIFNLRNLKFVKICLGQNRVIIRIINSRIDFVFYFGLVVSLIFDNEFIMGIISYVIFIC